jgi:hypothetical protein
MVARAQREAWTTEAVPMFKAARSYLKHALSTLSSAVFVVSS